MIIKAVKPLWIVEKLILDLDSYQLVNLDVYSFENKNKNEVYF